MSSTSVITARETSNTALKRRLKSTFLPLGAITVLLAAIWAIMALVPNFSGVPLGYDNPYPKGARALAQVLGDEGVNVTATDNLTDTLTATNNNTDTTIWVTSSEFLTSEDARELTETGAHLVWTNPTPDVLDALPISVSHAGGWATDDSTPPDCDLPAATSAGSITSGGTSFSFPGIDVPRGTNACYDSGFGYHLIDVMVDNGPRITLLDDGYLWSNERITADGHAALGLTLLGSNPSLVWFTPASPEPPTLLEDGELATPIQFTLVATLLAIAAVFVILAAMRRLGPVVSEQLPVVVRASETVRGRARLYRQARAYDRASELLRSATALACAQRLGVSPHAEREALISAIVRVTHYSDTDISALLFGPAPRSEQELLHLADRLATLESEISDVR